MIICATGHRPEKLGGYGVDIASKLQHLAETYLKAQPDYIKGQLSVTSGMALGWDTAWALAALNLKINLICAVPFRGQDKVWGKESRDTYHSILTLAFHVEVVSEGGYSVDKMQIRNEWMADNSDRVAALWDGTAGGTANCVRYARKFGKPIDNLWEQWKLS